MFVFEHLDGKHYCDVLFVRPHVLSSGRAVWSRTGANRKLIISPL